MVNTGRRARNRAARHKQIFEAATAILDEDGVDALTMQDVADRVDCAVGTIYTYFSSKSALLAALQTEAVRVLAQSHEIAASNWEEHFDVTETDPRTAATARVLAITEMVLAWPEIQPREFAFLQDLITTRQEGITYDDSASVAPYALTLFAEAQVAVDAAVGMGIIGFDPDRPGDDTMSRTVRWMATIEGAAMLANAFAAVEYMDPDAFNLRLIGLRSINDLLTAWGASQSDLEAGRAMVDELREAGKLLPEAI